VKTVNKSVLIWYSARQMFDLVTDVARYPQFLPWCDHASAQPTVGSEQNAQVMAEVGIGFSGVRQSFTTRNTHSIELNSVHQVHLELVKGPFSKLDGVWLFTPLGSVEL
jgi:ribosome-associated toxin RatA of RatAB toxin-antitoxin module